MRKPESKFLATMFSAFPSAKRIETRSTEGIPDVYYNLGGKNRTGWVEGKRHGFIGANERIQSGLTASQSLFLGDHCDLGGFAFLLVGIGTQWYLFRGNSQFVTQFEKRYTQYDFEQLCETFGSIDQFASEILRTVLVGFHKKGGR